MALFGPKVRKLNAADYHEVLELYSIFFQTDEFFVTQFKGKDVKDSICKYWGPDILMVLNYGICHGLFIKGKLRAMQLSIDIQDWKNNHKDTFYHLFATEEDASNEWCNYLLDMIKQLQQHVIYTMALCHTEGISYDEAVYQCIGALLHEKGDRYAYVGDPSTLEECSCFTRIGYSLTECGDLIFVKKV